MLTEEQKNDELVKSLLGSGFGEDVIESWIGNGTLTLQKSTQYGPDDHGEGDPGDTHEKRADKGTEKREKEDKEEEEAKRSMDKREKEADTVKKSETVEEKTEEKEEEKVEKGAGCDITSGNPGDPNQLAKSLGIDSLFKSLEDSVLAKQAGANDEIMKSINAISDKFEKSLAGIRTAIEIIGNQAPKLKSDFSKAVIEKSIENGGGMKDDEGKTALSITKDRMVVRALIMKSIEEEQDDELKKSLEGDSYTYLADPIEGAVGEKMAKYLYEKKNVRLVF